MTVAITTGKQFCYYPAAEYEPQPNASTRVKPKPPKLKSDATGYWLRPLTHAEQIELYSLPGSDEVRVALRIAYCLPRALMKLDTAHPLRDASGAVVAFTADEEHKGASDDLLDQIPFVVKIELAGAVVHGAQLDLVTVEKFAPAQEG